MNYKRFARKHEEGIAREMRIKPQVNSGAIAGRKGDVYGPDLLVEDKIFFSQRKTFSIQRKWVEKIREEAFTMGKRFWALFLHGGGNIYDTDDDLVVISRKDFDILYQSYRQQEGQQ